MIEKIAQDLLMRNEGSCLDFKRQFYNWDNPHSKSEMLKDIIALCNRYDNEPAYLFFGVVAGISPREHELVGIDISSVPDEAFIQQYILSKLNRYVSINILIGSYKDLDIAIVFMDNNFFPTYAIKNEGNVQANSVYFRKGSSTGVMDPDEFRRRLSSSQAVNSSSIKASFSTGGAFNNLSHSKIIKYRPARQPWQVNQFPDNENYYEEMLYFIAGKKAFLEVYPSISNNNSLSAYDIKVKLNITSPARISCRSDLPSEPAKIYLGPYINRPWIKENPIISEKDGSHSIVYDAGSLHPSESVDLPPFYVLYPDGGGPLKLISTIYAKDMADPYYDIYALEPDFSTYVDVDPILFKL